MRVYILSREGYSGEERQMVKDEWQKFEREHYRKRVIWRVVARYAAMFVLPLGIAGYLWFTFTGKEIPLVNNTEIVPGGGKALLILVDGKSVELKGEKGLQVGTEGSVMSSVGEKVVYWEPEVGVDSLVEEKYNTLVVPRGGEFFLELSDGTRVWLNSESKLHFPLRFKGKQRKVELEGEGYFEVMPDSIVPFHVLANGADLKVLGTSFNVTTYRGRTIATLVEGKVCLTYEGESVLMLPNLQAEVIPDNREILLREVDVKNFIMWKNGIFYFEGADLATIMERLSQWYDVDVAFDDEKLKELRFSVEMKRYEHIQDLLTKIEKTQKVRFLIRGKNVHVENYQESDSLKK